MAANPPVDRIRLSIARYVIRLLEEKTNFVSTLVQQSDEQCCKGNFAASVECCRKAYDLAKFNSDYTAQASALLHMGLHYFVSPGMEFDRAADQCEEASRLYHTAYQSRGEIASLFGAALVLLYACKRGYDRWHRAMRTFVLAAEVEGAPTNLAERACVMRDATEAAFGRHPSLGLPSPLLRQRATVPSNGSGKNEDLVVSSPLENHSDAENFVVGGIGTIADPTVPSYRENPAPDGVGGSANPTSPFQPDHPQPAGAGATANPKSTWQASSQKTDAAKSTTNPPSKPCPTKEDEPLPKLPLMDPPAELPQTQVPSSIPYLLPLMPSEFIRDRIGVLPKLLGIFALVGLPVVIIFLIVDFWYFLSNQANLLFAFVTSMFLMFTASIFILLLILYVTNQLRVSIPRSHAAILYNRGRFWAIEEPTTLWLVPLVEYVHAYIPLDWRKVDHILHHQGMSDASTLAIRVKLLYRVSAPMSIWTIVIQPSSADSQLRMPVPISANRSWEYSDHAMRKISADALSQIATTQRDLLFRQPALNDLALKSIADHAASLGLYVHSVYVESANKRS